MRSPKGALASRNFRLLLGCDVIAGTGNAVAIVAIPFAVLSIGGSVADVGYVAATSLLLMVAFLLLGGVVADRLPRHQVMMAANLVQGLAQAGSATVLLTGHARIWELIIFNGMRGVGLGFYFPAAQGLLPQTVPPADRAQANAIDRVGRNSAQIGGSALGGVLVGVAGPGWGLAVDAIGYFAAAALRAAMRFPALTPAGSAGMISELRQGWREFIARRWLWVIVAEFSLLGLILVGVTSVYGPVVAQRSLGGASSWGLVMSGFACGAVAGGAIMIRYRPSRMLLVGTVGSGVIAVLPFALAVPLSVPLLVAAGVVIGISAEIFSVNWITTMQQEIPPELMSRLSAFDAMGSMALAPAGAVIAGPVALAVGLRAALVGGGALIVVLTLIVLTVPEVRHLRRHPAASPVFADAPDPTSDRAGPPVTPAPAQPG